MVHDCTYSGNFCRCLFTRDPKYRANVRKNLRERKHIDELKDADWINILLYFGLQERLCPGQIYLCGTDTGLTDQSESLRRCQNAQRWQQRVLEVQNDGRIVHDLAELGPLVDGELGSGKYPRPSQKKRSKFEVLAEAFQTLLSKYTPVPPISIKTVIPLNHSDFELEMFNPKNKDILQAACELYALEINSKTLGDLKEFYAAAKCPTFYSHDVDPFSYYHDRETSFDFVKRLLEYQIGEEENIKMFLTNLRDWFDKKGWAGNTKVNAICVVGPPNSGKNYFFDILAAIACNVGHIGRVNNKTNNFALQEVVNKRLVVGNEISMEDGAVEDFKKICEGAACNIRVKHQGDKIFCKTPVLLISNSLLSICYDTAFNNVRLYTMNWKSAPLLRESNKKPYPLVLFDLFDFYNILI